MATITIILLVITAILLNLCIYWIFRGTLVLKLWITLFPGILLAVLTAFFAGRYGQQYQLLFRVFSPIVVISSLLLSVIYTARSIVAPVQRVTEELDGIAALFDQEATQISATSQSLSESSQSHAAALEETSASLEEINVMAKKNSANAKEASDMTKEASRVVYTTNQSMESLNTSVSEIKDASAETRKIVKTSDEVAFQTNLLALNASVEAARAGEAGAGFSVVADEVRNLAVRASEAAKRTSVIIEETDQKITAGSELGEAAYQNFSMVTELTGKLSQLVDEISMASSQQAEGISQIHRALLEMDEIVQKNAATAEETSGFTVEISAQANRMRSAVAELVNLTGAGSNTRKKAFKALKPEGYAQHPVASATKSLAAGAANPQQISLPRP